MQWVIIITSLLSLFGLLVFVQDREVTTIDTTSQAGSTESAESRTTASETLDLSGSNLSTVPMDIFERSELTRLDLSDNRLSGSLPAEIRHLASLTYLDLSNNQFTGVPAEVGQLSKLEMLDLSGNQLTGLPHELGNLKNLKTLDLRGNKPSEFDLKVIRESIPSAAILLD